MDIELYKELKRAVQSRHVSVVRYLVNLPRLDIRHKDSKILKHAIWKYNHAYDIEIVRLLLEAGADCANNPSIIRCAVGQDDPVPLLRLLVQHGADVKNIVFADINDVCAVVPYLVREHGFDLEDLIGVRYDHLEEDLKNSPRWVELVREKCPTREQFIESIMTGEWMISARPSYMPDFF